MADLSDVTAAIASIIAAALYPTGAATPTSPSAAGPVCKIYEGWPNAPELDKDLAAGVVNVSIFPMPGSTATTYQLLDNPQVLTPAVHGVTAAIAGSVVTLSGTPGQGEYAMVMVNHRKSYSRGGNTTAAICAALLADLLADFPGSTASGSTLTIQGQSDIVVRIGAPATMGQVTHRQRESVMACVFAPTPALRTVVAKAVDVALKANVTIALPDGTEGRLVYEKTLVRDERETANVYRRDLIYSVEYATIETWTAYEVTSVGTTIDISSLAQDFANGTGGANATILG